MMLNTLPQYDTESGLPKYSDTNNEGFSDLFIGAKPKQVQKKLSCLPTDTLGNTFH